MNRIHRSILMIAFCSLMTSLSGQEVCLSRAWVAFGEKQYQETIKNCDECIENFREAALEMQTQLESQEFTNESFPTGVPAESMKEKIFKNWAINDISTAYYVRGLAAEKIYEKTDDETYGKMAEKSFEETCTFSFGRCWDEQGWFWSPCEAAKEK